VFKQGVARIECIAAFTARVLLRALEEIDGCVVAFEIVKDGVRIEETFILVAGKQGVILGIAEVIEGVGKRIIMILDLYKVVSFGKVKLFDNGGRTRL
jgi:hypothetical protein